MRRRDTDPEENRKMLRFDWNPEASQKCDMRDVFGHRHPQCLSPSAFQPFLHLADVDRLPHGTSEYREGGGLRADFTQKGRCFHDDLPVLVGKKLLQLGPEVGVVLCSDGPGQT